MEMGLLYISYVLFTTIAILLSLRLLGFRNTGLIGLSLGIINGTNDFVIKEILNSENNFFSGLHIYISILGMAILCYWLLRLKIFASFLVPILAYILTALGEIMILIFLISQSNKSLFEAAVSNIYTRIKFGFLTQVPLIINFVLIQFKFRNFYIYDLTKFVRKKRI